MKALYSLREKQRWTLRLIETHITEDHIRRADAILGLSRQGCVGTTVSLCHSAEVFNESEQQWDCRSKSMRGKTRRARKKKEHDSNNLKPQALIWRWFTHVFTVWCAYASSLISSAYVQGIGKHLTSLICSWEHAVEKNTTDWRIKWTLIVAPTFLNLLLIHLSQWFIISNHLASLCLNTPRGTSLALRKRGRKSKNSTFCLSI